MHRKECENVEVLKVLLGRVDGTADKGTKSGNKGEHGNSKCFT